MCDLTACASYRGAALSTPSAGTYPAILRIYENGDTLRWFLQVEGFTLRGRGMATRSNEGIVLAGRQGRGATISYTLTLKDQALEGAGVADDNRVYTLSVRKQAP